MIVFCRKAEKMTELEYICPLAHCVNRDSTKSCGLALTRYVVELLLKCVFSFKLVLLVSYIICGFSSPDSFGYPDILLCVVSVKSRPVII